MSRVTRILGPATCALAVLSLVLAIGCESWLARPVWNYLPEAAALAGVIGLVMARVAPWPALAAMLFFTYLVPVVPALLSRRVTGEYFLVWSAALTGVIAGDRDRWAWAYPRGWRLALVLWALTVAVAWPITALREIDFESLTLLQRYNIPNTGIGGSPRLVISWGMDTAIVHLLGLLWFNWLFRRARQVTDVHFQRWIAWPMAASIIAGSCLALYQGLFDLNFLSAGAWAYIRRASGSLMDANAYGAAAALWTAGLVAFVTSSWRERAATFAGAAVCWGGLWMSGSRTGLTSAGIPLAFVALAAARQAVGGRLRLRVIAGGAAAVVVLAAALLLAPAASESPLMRLKDTLPSDASAASLSAFGREMWNRNGYGKAATALIAEHPATGVGIGLFNLSGAAYQRNVYYLPPDNAQNWWRHHVAELGFIGAAGLLLWTVVFLMFLARTSGERQRRLPAAALKGAIVGLALISLVGMPTQSLPVTMTFWTFAFWYTRLVAPAENEDAAPAELSRAQWALVLAVVGVYAGTMLVLARGHERPAMRAARGQWRYTYGVYDPGGAAPPGETRRWTERHGVTVIANDAPWMILTIRAEHPDIRENPVRASVEVNGRTVVEQAIHTDAPIVRVVYTGPAPRAIVEAHVDRTWRPPDAPARQPDAGVSLSWRFASEPPAGVATITAPLPR